MFSAMSRVVLRSFNGALHPPAECRSSENYWLLLGATGTVVEPVNSRGRVLVKFDVSVADLGLACHNPVPNALHIVESDLEHLS